VPIRCTVLDDFQGVALRCADWSVLAPDVEVTALAEHLTDGTRWSQRWPTPRSSW
jgi:hypothetical protein